MLKFKVVNAITGLLVFGSLIGYLWYEFPVWPITIILLIWLLLTMAGSAFIGWNYHFNSLNSNPRIKENHVAITFDDGPNPEFTSQVLELLAKFNCKATFFCIGKQIEAHPELFQTILENGHTIGNHTYSHSNSYGLLSAKKVLSDIQKNNQIIKEQTGLVPLLFRPAFGVTNPRIKKAIKTIGMRSIGWNKRSFDTTNLDEKSILARITKNLKSGDVILLHDASAKTVRVLEQLLLFLQQQNKVSVTVDTLFNIKAYA